ncbi:MAG: hypothetical protein AAGG69_06745 [Pseudomonadota bacterium]
MNGAMAVHLVASSAGFALGSVFLKRYADAGSLGDLGLAFGVFAASNLLYVPVLARGLGQGAALSSMAHLMVMSSLGVLIFGEKLGPYNVAGLITALITVWLFALAQHST